MFAEPEELQHPVLSEPGRHGHSGACSGQAQARDSGRAQRQRHEVSL